MADIHVLDGDVKGTWRIVMHFVVPSGNNSAGMSWADVLVNSGVGGSTQLPSGNGVGGTIGPAEKTAIEVGTIFEHIASFRIESGGTSNNNIRTILRQFYASESTNILGNLRRRLKYFGITESEV